MMSMQARDEAIDGTRAQPAPPLVSVIMIFLNAERFIEEAIASVFAQTWPHWELLLVDDGSTDRSTAIAGRYAAAHPERVRYLEHPGHANRGMSASRNLGIAQARGAYIAFLDADDGYLPERLARHVAVLEAHPAVDVVQGREICWVTWQGQGDKDYSYINADELNVLMEPPSMLVSMFQLRSALHPGICSLTFRTKALIDVGGFEDIFTDLYEDQALMIKIYLHKNVYPIGDMLSLYRMHEASSTAQARMNGTYRPGYPHRARGRLLDWAAGYLRAQGVTDPAVWRGLEAERWQYRHPTSARLCLSIGDARRWMRAMARGMAKRVLATLLPAPCFDRVLEWQRDRWARNAAQRVELVDLAMPPPVTLQPASVLHQARASSRSRIAIGSQAATGRSAPSLSPNHPRIACPEPSKAVRSEVACELVQHAEDGDPPLVSVIMIFLNAERFIEEAIASVFAQTWPHWELLLVDDGSTDRSTAIAGRYAAAHPERVRYLEHPGHANRGTGPSRNLGMAAARGTYIAFLDADDVYLPDRLKAHVTLLEAEPRLGITVSHELYWWSWQDPAASTRDRIVGLYLVGKVLAPPDLLVAIFSMDAAMPGICSITLRRAVLAIAGGCEDSFVDQYEDQVLIAKFVLHSHTYVIDACLAKYRQHPASLTYQARLRGEYVPGGPHAARWVFLEWLRQHLDERNIQAPLLERAIANELWHRDHPRLAQLLYLLRETRARARSAAGRAVRAVVPASAWARNAAWRYERRRRGLEARTSRTLDATGRGRVT